MDSRTGRNKHRLIWVSAAVFVGNTSSAVHVGPHGPFENYWHKRGLRKTSAYRTAAPAESSVMQNFICFCLRSNRESGYAPRSLETKPPTASRELCCQVLEVGKILPEWS